MKILDACEAAARAKIDAMMAEMDRAINEAASHEGCDAAGLWRLGYRFEIENGGAMRLVKRVPATPAGEVLADHRQLVVGWDGDPLPIDGSRLPECPEVKET